RFPNQAAVGPAVEMGQRLGDERPGALECSGPTRELPRRWIAGRRHDAVGSDGSPVLRLEQYPLARRPDTRDRGAIVNSGAGTLGGAGEPLRQAVEIGFGG